MKRSIKYKEDYSGLGVEVIKQENRERDWFANQFHALFRNKSKKDDKQEEEDEKERIKNRIKFSGFTETPEDEDCKLYGCFI